MTSVKAVTPKGSVTADSGYIALVFTKKLDFINFNQKDVYLVLQRLETGRRYYIPYGYNDEIRLIAATPGDYRFEDFVYFIGFGSIEHKDAAKKPEGVLHGTPMVSGASLVNAAYPDELKKEFTVNAGEITYVGDYSYDTQISFTEPGVIIKRAFSSATSVYYKVRDKYPNMPESFQVVSIEEK
jgi:hypothetical protein